jgi:hypothetical protein
MEDCIAKYEHPDGFEIAVVTYFREDGHRIYEFIVIDDEERLITIPIGEELLKLFADEISSFIKTAES